MTVRLLVLLPFLVTGLPGATLAQCRPHPETRVDSGATLGALPRPEAKPAKGQGLALPKHDIARAGLTIAAVEPASAAPELRALGRVLDPLPLIQTVHALRATSSALAVARSEHARVTKLHENDRNASTRDLETARATLDRATLDFADATVRLALAWGSSTTQHNDVDLLADDLGRGRSAVARVDLPAGEALSAPPAAVSFSATNHDVRGSARLLGPAPTTDPLLQGEAYFFLIERDPPAPGTSLVATLLCDQRPILGVSVPRSAIVWHDGRPLVYVELQPDVFERRTIELRMPLDDAWLVTTGVVPGDRIVLEGVQQLLSEELLAVHPTD
jgi:hypothetical protein